MKETTINQVPVKIEMTPEARALNERINNPQDLNDALLSVQIEEEAERLRINLNGKIKEFIAPWFAW